MINTKLDLSVKPVKIRKRRIVPTKRQKLALDNLVVNGGIVQPAMRAANYAEATVNTPQKLTESKGFKLLCEERGLTDKLLVDSLVEDIKKKKQNRKAELELGFKVKGKLSEAEGEKNLTLIKVNINYFKPDGNRIEPKPETDIQTGVSV